MNDVVIVEAVRTPSVGFAAAWLVCAPTTWGASDQPPARARECCPDKVEDVIFGCVTQIGEQSANIARTALLGAGWPVDIPGLTIDRKCGSGEVAVHFAAGAVPAVQRR